VLSEFHTSSSCPAWAFPYWIDKKVSQKEQEVYILLQKLYVFALKTVSQYGIYRK
jgi:hypothetical protein